MPARDPKFDPIHVAKLATVKGGLLKKPMALPIMCVELEGHTMEFTHMTTRQDWLCKAVSGECVSRRPLSRVKLLRVLAEKLYGVSTGADDVDDELSPDDPMNAVEFEDSPPKTAQAGTSNASKAKTPRATEKKIQPFGLICRRSARRDIQMTRG